jgi:thiosulfate/3-mercaptopyruvate sulfurtransferase
MLMGHGRQSLPRVLRVCGFVAVVFTLGLLAPPGSRMQRATVQAAAARAQNAASKPQAPPDPWTVSETVTPSDLAKERGDPNPADRPVVACVGFRFLYDGGHVPGASFHGPASKNEGLADLKAWAQSLPKSSNVVLYCGCCPLVRCPNLRPAFTALHDVGFARLRVLLLPTNFGTDWAAKGYPVEKSK